MEVAARHAVGALSVPLAALAGAATTVALSMATRDSLIRFWAESMRWAIPHAVQGMDAPVRAGVAGVEALSTINQRGARNNGF
jgi:hypothetical protein